MSGGISQLKGYFERATRLHLNPFFESGDVNFDLSSICNFIIRNITNGVTLAEAAKYAGYSPNYFSMKFRSATGTNFREYVDFIKMRKALRILLSGEVNVSEAAQLFGYDNSQNFNRAFKRINKISPSQVIKSKEKKSPDLYRRLFYAGYTLFVYFLNRLIQPNHIQHNTQCG